MQGLRSPLLIVALLTGALALSPLSATQGDHHPRGGYVPHDQLFPMPSAGLSIKGEDQTLVELLDDFAKVTGEHVLYSRDTQSLLENMRPSVYPTLEVAPQNVYAVVQQVLIASRFVMIDLRRQEPRMLQVASLDSPARASIKQSATYVPVEHLHEYALDAAFLIQTIVELPHLDVRTMGASMRQLVVDPNTMQLIPMPESSQMILTGFGDQVHQLVRMLQRMDEGSRHAEERLRDGQMHQALMKAANRLGVDEDEDEDD